MLFWYPGEAGSTAEAQNTLDAFFEFINKRITPDKVIGKYFNNVAAGLNFIKQSKPSFGILSFAAYEINKDKLGAVKVIMQTMPLPAGKETEIYTIVGKGQKPASQNFPLYTKQPLTLEFAQTYIFDVGRPAFFLVRRAVVAEVGEGSPTEVGHPNLVPNILPLLKDLASGLKTGGAILQPMEYFTLQRLNQPWTKELSVWHTSKPVPSAPLVIFGPAAMPLAQKLKDVLRSMPEDPEGIQILETLRLKGFSN